MTTPTPRLLPLAYDGCGCCAPSAPPAATSDPAMTIADATPSDRGSFGRSWRLDLPHHYPGDAAALRANGNEPIGAGHMCRSLRRRYEHSSVGWPHLACRRDS